MSDIELSELTSGIRLRTGRHHRLRVRLPEGDHIVVEQPATRTFMPHRVTGPNTITVRYELTPKKTPLPVKIEVHDKDGARVYSETETVTDNGEGVDFVWNGKDKAGYVDTRKSPFRLTLTASREGKALKGLVREAGKLRETGEQAGPVELVAVPLVDRGWVVSRLADDQPWTGANKVVAADARPQITGVVRAIVGGVRAPERGKTHRAYYWLSDPAPTVRLDGEGGPGAVTVTPWDEKLYSGLTLAWEKIVALGLHSPVYRPHQNETRLTRHGEFTNVYSNGPKEPQWIGIDTCEYAHHAAGTGLSPSADAGAGTLRWRFDVDYQAAHLRLPEAERPGSAGKRDPVATTAKKVRSGLGKDFSGRLGGAGEHIHRISRRGASPVAMLSYLETYRRVPWIYGSVGRQTDAFVGYDCADLATGAARKAGLTSIAYTNAHNLCELHTKKRMDGKTFYLDGDKIKNLADDKEVTIAFGGTDTKNAQLGDIVFFDWQNNDKWDHTTILWSNSGASLSRATQLVWAHHDAASTDGFYVGTLGELIGSSKERVFTLRYF